MNLSLRIYKIDIARNTRTISYFIVDVHCNPNQQIHPEPEEEECGQAPEGKRDVRGELTENRNVRDHDQR